MSKIALLHGPNLNRLGEREPSIYGHLTLPDIIHCLQAAALKQGFTLLDYQSNHEGDLIDHLWTWKDEGVQGIIINPGGLSHTSVALRDALLGIQLPAIEVHIANVHARESFRHTLITAGACKSVISGLGLRGYTVALEALLERLTQQK